MYERDHEMGSSGNGLSGFDFLRFVRVLTFFNLSHFFQFVK